MDHKNYLGELGGARFDKKAWMVAFFISLFIIVGLTVALITKKDTSQTTFIPPGLSQPFKIVNGQYSTPYVEQVATWFISLALSYTPSSFEYQMNTFLKHIDPDLFSQLRQTLLEEFEDIKTQRRSSTFFVQRVVIRDLRAIVTGVRQIKIATTDASLEQEYWYVRLTQRQDGLITLAEFKEVMKQDVKAFTEGAKK